MNAEQTSSSYLADWSSPEAWMQIANLRFWLHTKFSSNEKESEFGSAIELQRAATRGAEVRS